jgi:hypothetical protein
MNCEDFNEIINELADSKPMAVSIRDAGVSHVALCADCAAKLANARAVSSTLMLAAGAESEEAPARIKSNLMAAFAARQQAEPITNSNVVHLSSRRHSGWWTTAAVAAAAAVILFAVLLPFWKSARAPVSQPPQIAENAPVMVPIAAPSPTEKPPPVSKPDSTNKGSGGSRKPRVSRDPNRRVINAGEIETVARNTSTEFLPLTYLASATAIDTGTIVRVQLSKSALVRLGLPINIESSNESVRAEVVIGDDGVARAIRLVN